MFELNVISVMFDLNNKIRKHKGLYFWNLPAILSS
jgi:hypothetical protein